MPSCGWPISCVALLLACDPAADIVAAEVSEVVAPAGRELRNQPTERLPITPDNGRIAWTAAKLHVKEEGSFSRFAGELRLDTQHLEHSEVEVRIETASLHAEPDRLADHLRDSDFLDTARFPVAFFRSTSLAPVEQGATSAVSPASEGDIVATHQVSGELTLHGITRRITFPAQIHVGAAVAVRAEFSIDRIDFDIAPKRADHMIRHRVAIHLSLELPRAPRRSAP